MVLNNHISILFDTFKAKSGCIDDSEAIEMLISRYNLINSEKQKLIQLNREKDRQIKVLSSKLAEILALIESLDK